MPNNSNKKVKSTLFLSEARREMIRSSGLSVEEYINRILDKYEFFSFDKWNDGVFWVHQYRIGIFMAETMNYCFSQFEDRKLYETGQEAGRRARVSFEYEEKKSSNQISEILNDLNSLVGWGHFNINNKTIIVRDPLFTSPYFIYGFLEGILKETLNITESTNNRIVFELKGDNTVIAQSEKVLLDLLYNYQLSLEKATTIEDIAHATVSTISNSIVYDAIGFGIIEKEKTFRFIHTIPKELPLTKNWSLTLVETGVTYRMTKIGRSAFSKEEKVIRIQENEEEPLIRTELMIPIKVEGKIVAFLYVQSNRLNPFRYREHRILETLAMSITSTLYRLKSSALSYP